MHATGELQRVVAGPPLTPGRAPLAALAACKLPPPFPRATPPAAAPQPPAAPAVKPAAGRGVGITAAGAGGAAAGSAPHQDGTPRPLPDLTTIRGMLFDIDGTLTDSDPLHFLA